MAGLILFIIYHFFFFFRHESKIHSNWSSWRSFFSFSFSRCLPHAVWCLTCLSAFIQFYYFSVRAWAKDFFIYFYNIIHATSAVPGAAAFCVLCFWNWFFIIGGDKGLLYIYRDKPLDHLFFKSCRYSPASIFKPLFVYYRTWRHFSYVYKTCFESVVSLLPTRTTYMGNLAFPQTTFYYFLLQYMQKEAEWIYFLRGGAIHFFSCL